MSVSLSKEQMSILFINRSIPIPLVSKIYTYTEQETLHLEVPYLECTPEALFKHKNLIDDVEYIFVVTPQQEECHSIFDRWSTALTYGTSPKSLFSTIATYSEISSIPVYSIDAGSAVLLSLAYSYYQQSFTTGVLLVYAGEYRTAVISLFEGKIYGTFAFCSALLEREDLIQALQDFKNSWLPTEEIQIMGGCGSIFAKDIPNEAIFSATYIIGKKTHKFESLGKILPQESIPTLLLEYCTKHYSSLKKNI